MKRFGLHILYVDLRYIAKLILIMENLIFKYSSQNILL